MTFPCVGRGTDEIRLWPTSSMRADLFPRSPSIATQLRFHQALLISTFVTLLCISAQAEGILDEEITSYDQLKNAAQRLSWAEYKPQPALPEALAKLSYDDLRLIAFRTNKSVILNGNRSHRLEFFHKGYVSKDDVAVNLISRGEQFPVPFASNFFDYRGKLADLKVPRDLGFAGFRIAGKFPQRNDLQEIITFLGASYFRARGEQHGYGSSARGLAINCGLPKAEEFPIFREFWVIDDQNPQEVVHLLALMDSPSVTGAYQFTLIPGLEKTDIDVQATVYFRQTPEKVGFAPLTSMWMWGDGLAGPQGDPRPEVHDADGLLMHCKDGKWIWRVLGRLDYPSLMRFECDGIRGFGLFQRDTDPNHYLDQEAKYHARPSLWIEPKSDWGPGHIELLELDAHHEAIDNIAAWWVTHQELGPQRPIELAYRVSFCTQPPVEHRLAKGAGYRVTRDQPGKIRLEIDFSGPGLAARSPSDPPTVQVQSVRGHVNVQGCHKGPDGNWTARLEIEPSGEGPIEITTVLKDKDQELSETWKYLCPLTPPPVSLPPWRTQDATSQEKQP